MRRALLLCLLLPALADAQTALPTEFPKAAVPLEPAALKKLLDDRTFVLKQAVGPEIRVQFRGAYAYFNVGNRSDSGPWRVEGSAYCVDWRASPGGCSEVRLDGDVIVSKRASNGEVVVMKPN